MSAPKIFFVIFAVALLGTSLIADAQQPKEVLRIGYLGSNPPTTAEFVPIYDAFRQGLRDLGYVEGQNIVIERRFAEGRLERFPDLAAELVRLRVNIIVGEVTPAIQAAQRATSTIPIVMSFVGDPVANGFVASLARPGGNITGLSIMAPELVGKRLELLKEVVPRVSRVAVLWNPANPLGAPQLREVEVAARAFGMRLQPLEARGPSEFDSAFAAMTRERAGALIVLGDVMFSFHRTRVAELAAKSRLPAVYTNRGHVEAGGLMSFGPSYADLNRRAASYVDKILKGAKPGDLPVEQPTKFELVINLRTAKALGLTIPNSLLLRASEIIQ